jgi:hypothetical protein
MPLNIKNWQSTKYEFAFVNYKQLHKALMKKFQITRIETKVRIKWFTFKMKVFEMAKINSDASLDK